MTVRLQARQIAAVQDERTALELNVVSDQYLTYNVFAEVKRMA